jgi:long-chain fatty acid transport protein
MWEQMLQLSKKCSLAVIILSVVSVSTVYAGGFETSNFNGEAVVNSAKIAASNPAGLAVVERSEVILTGAAVITNIEFKSDSNNTESGSDGGDQGDTTGGGGFSLAHKINPDLGIGLALTSPAGGSMDPDDDWVGRYIMTEVDFIVLALTGSIGYKVNDWLALGAGISGHYAEFELDIAIATGGADGKAEIDTDDTAVGFTLGALLMPMEGTKIGIAYRSEVEYEVGGDLDTTSGLSSSIGTDFPLPQRVLVSLSQKVGEGTVIIADVGWTDFSEFDAQTVDLEKINVSTSIPRNWDDTWRFGLAVQHRIDPQWGINGGITYDTSPMDDEDRLPDMPFDRQISVSTGLNYVKNENLSIGLGYKYIDLGDAKIDFTGPTGTRLSGEYDDNNVHMVALNVTYKY